MIVGTYATGVGLNAPPLAIPSAGSGMQDGSCSTWPVALTHALVLLESHPQPGPAFAGAGLLPRNPSVVAATALRWPPHDGLSASLNVASLIANFVASATRLGIWVGV